MAGRRPYRGGSPAHGGTQHSTPSAATQRSCAPPAAPLAVHRRRRGEDAALLHLPLAQGAELAGGALELLLVAEAKGDHVLNVSPLRIIGGLLEC